MRDGLMKTLAAKGKWNRRFLAALLLLCAAGNARSQTSTLNSYTRYIEQY